MFGFELKKKAIKTRTKKGHPYKIAQCGVVIKMDQSFRVESCSGQGRRRGHTARHNTSQSSMHRTINLTEIAHTAQMSRKYYYDQNPSEHVTEIPLKFLLN